MGTAPGILGLVSSHVGPQIGDLLKDWKSVMLGVWVAPGALETLQKGGERTPSTCRKGLQGLRGHPDPKNDRFPILKHFENFLTKPKCSHVYPAPPAYSEDGQKMVTKRP